MEDVAILAGFGSGVCLVLGFILLEMNSGRKFEEQLAYVEGCMAASVAAAAREKALLSACENAGGQANAVLPPALIRLDAGMYPEPQPDGRIVDTS